MSKLDDIQLDKLARLTVNNLDSRIGGRQCYLKPARHLEPGKPLSLDVSLSNLFLPPPPSVQPDDSSPKTCSEGCR